MHRHSTAPDVLGTQEERLSCLISEGLDYSEIPFGNILSFFLFFSSKSFSLAQILKYRRPQWQRLWIFIFKTKFLWQLSHHFSPLFVAELCFYLVLMSGSVTGHCLVHTRCVLSTSHSPSPYGSQIEKPRLSCLILCDLDLAASGGILGSSGLSSSWVLRFLPDWLHTHTHTHTRT